MPEFYTTNLFPLHIEATGVALTSFSIDHSGGVQLNAGLLGELSFHLGRQLHALAQVRGAGIVAVGSHPDPAERLLNVDGDTFRVTVREVVTVDLSDPAWGETIRRLMSEDLRVQLAGRGGVLWHRGQSGYYEPVLLGGRNGAIGWCDGTMVEVVSFSQGRLALALDRTVARLGRPLGKMPPAERVTYVATDPYRGLYVAPSEDEAESEADLSPQSRKQRNYVHINGDQILGRVYVDVPRTLEDRAERIYIRRGHDGPSEAVLPDDVRPVLAPGEVKDSALPAGSRPQRTPHERFDWARGFAKAHLQSFSLLGHPAQVMLHPVEQRDLNVELLPWPALAVGADGGTVPPPDPGANLAEYRVDALRQRGFRHVPPGWGGVMIVPLEGEEELARTLLIEVRGYLRAWRFAEKPGVRMSEVPLPATGGASQRVEVVARHLRALAPEARPSALIVFKDNDWARGAQAQDLYQAIHEQIGRQCNLPLKVVQARNYDNWESVAQIDLMGVLARAGAIPWGLASAGAEPALHHDLVFAMDIGGRDRSGRDRSEYVGFVAMAGASAPRFHHAHPDADREAVPPDLLEELVLDAATRLAGSYQGSWLFLRDGRFPDQELEALGRAAQKALDRRLIGPGQSFTAVEVHKAHALRLFGVAQDTVVQPECGALMWLNGPPTGKAARGHSEALLASTGSPWNLGGARSGPQATAKPIRCLVTSLTGPVAHREALSDIWRLTHLPWQMPRAPIKLPFPLHCATTLLEDLSNGRVPYVAPC